MTDLAQWMRSQLDRHNMTQAAASVHAGVGQATLGDLLSKGHIPEQRRCQECCRLIRSGERHYETGEGEWLCEQCAGHSSQVVDTMLVTDLVVELIPGHV